MRGIIDRFEGKYAVVELEGRTMENILRKDLPQNVKEGDAIVMINGQWQADRDKTAALKAEIENLSKDLFE